MTEKRYYWLKMPENFFDTEEMKYIEEQPNGIEYSNIYMKILLKSITGNGLLIRNVGKMVIPYDLDGIAKMTGFKRDTVRCAMDLFYELGLVEVLQTGEILMKQLQGMIGHETDAAARMRKSRERKRLEERNNVTSDVTDCDTSLVTLPRPACNGDRNNECKNVTVEYIENKSIKSIKENKKEKKVKPSALSGRSAELCGRIITYLNEKTGRSFKPQTKSTQRLIQARLNEGFTEEEFYRVIDNKVLEWATDPKMQQFLRPETLFGNKFEGYLNSKPVPRAAYDRQGYKAQSDEIAAQADYFDDYLKQIEV